MLARTATRRCTSARSSADSRAGGAASRARRFLRLGRAERRLAVRAALLVAAIRAALVILPVRSVHRLLAVGAARSRWRGQTGPARWRGPRSAARRRRYPPATPEDLARAVARASGVVPGATCLVQALALEALLEQTGCPARLAIGFARSGDGVLGGHAWVEAAGTVFPHLADRAGYAVAARAADRR